MDEITLRKVQLAQLEIAKEIKRVCDENNISYFLESGTLLEAIRHDGFIPWDDDMDLGMKREDYERFLEIAPSKLDSKYMILQWKDNAGYGFPFCKVINKQTEYIEKKTKDASYNQGLYVDIFPYDKFPANKQSQAKQRVVLSLLKATIRNKCKVKSWETEEGINYFKLIKNVLFIFVSKLFSKDFLVEIYEKYAQMHNKDLNYEYYFSQGIEPYGTFKFPKEVINSTEIHKFENIEFKCPFNSKIYLQYAYGDYMKLPPESERENRHMIIKVKFENED